MSVSVIVHYIYLYVSTFRQEWKSELNTYRVEAAWKLGQWDLLEDYLSSGDTLNHLQLCLCVYDMYCMFIYMFSRSFQIV